VSGLDPGEWPVLVTGAGGFVGGHVARALSRAGHAVRGLSRRPVPPRPEDPPIDWLLGDLRDPAVRREAVRGARAVVHAAGWVSLGSDPSGDAVAINVEATRGLLDEALAAGVERFIYTSTLHTVATGTAEEPADEDTPWNLHTVDAPYSRTKRAAERLVLDHDGPMQGVVICPGMVLGPGDVRPTSTKLLLVMSRARVALLPGGGIPVVDTEVIARAHVRALAVGEVGRRYTVVGPYLSYHAMAGLVAQVCGRPRRVVTIPDWLEGPVVAAGRLADFLARGRGDVSGTAAAGGFLQLHVRGDRADRAFGLAHPPPIRSVFAALDDARRHGRAPWLGMLRDPDA
jgi:dihydroflavonol-4-reductase